MKWMGAAAAGMAGLEAFENMAAALTKGEKTPALIWINDHGTDVNLLSLLGNEVPGFLDLVQGHWDVIAHEALMPMLYTRGPQPRNQAPILVVEQIPPYLVKKTSAENPLLKTLQASKAVVQLGTDACFGGMVIPPSRIDQFDLLCREVKTPVIKLPGVPTPPHHVVGVLAHLEYFGFPRVDGRRRPLIYYGETVCRHCEHQGDLQRGRFAKHYGGKGCLLHLGCKGPITHNTCSKQRWNGGRNWCVGAGGPCTGCSEPGFPDHGGLGLFGNLTGSIAGVNPGVWGNIERIGLGILGLAAGGVFLQGMRRFFAGDKEGESAERTPRKDA